LPKPHVADHRLAVHDLERDPLTADRVSTKVVMMSPSCGALSACVAVTVEALRIEWRHLQRTDAGDRDGPALRGKPRTDLRPDQAAIIDPDGAALVAVAHDQPPRTLAPCTVSSAKYSPESPALCASANVSGSPPRFTVPVMVSASTWRGSPRRLSRDRCGSKPFR